MLGPKHQPKSTLDDADAVADTESGVQGDTRGDEAGELPEVLTPQNLGRLRASSMGLSFCVGADIDAVAVTASWGQYIVQDTEDEEGRKRTAWTREPRDFQKETRLDGPSDKLLNRRAVSDGFATLWERGRLDLTVEALALDPKFRSLFTDRELETARSRPEQFGYVPRNVVAR